MGTAGQGRTLVSAMSSLLSAVRKIEPSCAALIRLLQVAYTSAKPEREHIRVNLEAGKVLAPIHTLTRRPSYARAQEMSLATIPFHFKRDSGFLGADKVPRCKARVFSSGDTRLSVTVVTNVCDSVRGCR